MPRRTSRLLALFAIAWVVTACASVSHPPIDHAPARTRRMGEDLRQAVLTPDSTPDQRVVPPAPVVDDSTADEDEPDPRARRGWRRFLPTGRTVHWTPRARDLGDRAVDAEDSVTAAAGRSSGVTTAAHRGLEWQSGASARHHGAIHLTSPALSAGHIRSIGLRDVLWPGALTADTLGAEHPVALAWEGDTVVVGATGASQFFATDWARTDRFASDEIRCPAQSARRAQESPVVRTVVRLTPRGQYIDVDVRAEFLHDPGCESSVWLEDRLSGIADDVHLGLMRNTLGVRQPIE